MVEESGRFVGNGEVYELSYTLEVGDISALSREVSKRSTGRNEASSALPLFIVLFLLFTLINVAFPENGTIFMWGGIVGAIVLFVAFWRVHKKFVLMMIGGRPTEVSMTFRPGCVTVINIDGATDYRYVRARDLWETKDYFFLWAGGINVEIVPKRCFETEEAMDEFRGVLKWYGIEAEGGKKARVKPEEEVEERPDWV